MSSEYLRLLIFLPAIFIPACASSRVSSRVHEILQARTLEWVAFPSLGYLPDPGIEPRFPELQADSLPTELWGNPSESGEEPWKLHFHRHRGGMWGCWGCWGWVGGGILMQGSKGYCLRITITVFTCWPDFYPWSLILNLRSLKFTSMNRKRFLFTVIMPGPVL